MNGTEQMRVTVREVIYRSQDGRYAVLDAEPEVGNEPVVLVGDVGDVSPGETLKVHGSWKEHRQYGRRLHVESFTPVTPTTREGIKRYLGSGLVPGVGEAIAARLVDRFGERTLDVITQQSARLREVSGIGPQRAEAIAEAVRKRAAEAESMAYLQGLGLGPALAKRIRGKYGEDTVKVLRGDPYLVAEEVDGVGFRTADRVGRALGYDTDDPRRAAGAVLHLLGRAADDGHVFLSRDELVAEGRALEVPEERVREAFDTLAGRGLVILDGDDVYAPPLHRAEVMAARALSRLSRPRAPVANADDACARAMDRSLAPAQREAVRASFDHGLFVLTGGPGTGKTTTVRTLVRAHRLLQRKVVLCAPTGRAAKRLSEATGAEARTIHRLLEFNPATGRFQRNAQDPLEADLVLVDEASMVDIQLGSRLLDALPSGATLALVGDVDQLPPVGPGPLLRELLDSGACPVIRLTLVFRQAQQSAIVRAAHDILANRLPEPTASGTRGDGDLFIVRASDPELICQRLLETLERMRAAYDLDPVHDVQVLTPMRRGPLGTERLNPLIQDALNPGGGGTGPFRPGDKVMQLRNDYEREVFNGDLGQVVRADSRLAVVDMGGRRVVYEGDARNALSLAYASTIHKVQGSEFPAIIVVLHGAHYMLLSRPLIYTAITRARELVVILGDQRALRRAVSNTAIQATNCRLAARLQLETASRG